MARFGDHSIPYHKEDPLSVNFSDFESRWKTAGGAERANYGLFLQDLCALLGVAPPDPTTDNPAQDAYVLERRYGMTLGPCGRIS